ncbi:transporter substrate-binding domain-containing protein [Gammaproteobacteria bacterium]|nr:transporter substrate-binding domain-containing protein [Gammaproteobacteria bacterium]
MLSSTIFAEILYDGLVLQKFCNTPLHSQIVKVFPVGQDLAAIKERKVFRVLLHQKKNGCVISRTERELLEEFALLNDLDLNWIYIENSWDLLPQLLNGKGDIIVAQDQSLSVNIQDEINFSHVWANSTFKIVERADSSRISRNRDLAGRQIAAYRNSPVWDKLVELSNTQVGMVLQEIPSSVSYYEVMQRVKTAQYDLVVADSLFLDIYLPVNSELQANFVLSKQRKMAWAISNSAEELHKSLNQYLSHQRLTQDIAPVYFEDFSSIKDRGVLRVITYANPSHYYLYKGNLFGFEYELLKQFAKSHMLRLNVILAHTQDEMFELLNNGKGDLIAASLPRSIIKESKSVSYTVPYNYASPILIGRVNEEPIIDIRELAGRRVTLAQDSPYWDFMLKLKDQGLKFELVKANDGVNLEGTMLMVALGIYDLTVVGDHQITAAKPYSVGVEAQFILSEPQAHRWAVRSDRQQLFNSLNDFLNIQFRNEKYNVLHAKYFEQPQSEKYVNARLTKITSLSPYDDMTQKYSAEYGFDWRLITALMFQESQFDPKANSYAGAQGLMQMIPATAEFMGVSNLNNPKSSIDGGVRYLNYLRSRFEDSILLQDRIWFTLASYNAGYGRVKRARKLAKIMGLDKDKWFDNVEVAMMGLGKFYTKKGKQVPYCQCGQTVVYVREIRTRYFNYIGLIEAQKLAALLPEDRISEYKKFN